MNSEEEIIAEEGLRVRRRLRLFDRRGKVRRDLGSPGELRTVVWTPLPEITNGGSLLVVESCKLYVGNGLYLYHARLIGADRADDRDLGWFRTVPDAEGALRLTVPSSSSGTMKP